MGGQRNETTELTYNLGIVTPRLQVVSVVDTGVFRVSNTDDGMWLNEGFGREEALFGSEQAENEEKDAAWNQNGRPKE